MHLWLPSDSVDNDDNQRQGKIDNDYGVLRAMQELLTKHVDSISGNDIYASRAVGTGSDMTATVAVERLTVVGMEAITLKL